MSELLIFLVAIIFIGSVLSKPKKKKRNKREVKKANDIGADGERVINQYLSNKKGLLVDDFLFKLGETYCQIDHVFIFDKGIVVIETKNHSGRIYGEEGNRNWTVAYGSNKYSMYNPLMQNQSHINKLKKLVGADINIIGVVVFVSDKCSFNNNIKGVYTFEEFKKKFDKLINIKGNSIDKRKIYNMLKGLDLSNSNYHRKKQINYANKMKK